jgi:hypothetical protein
MDKLIEIPHVTLLCLQSPFIVCLSRKEEIANLMLRESIRYQNRTQSLFGLSNNSVVVVVFRLLSIDIAQ